MSIKERIGQRILTERQARGLSRKALADLTDDLKQSRINNWERGDRTPGPEEIQQLAKVLDVSPAYLMCLTDDKNADKPKKIPGLGALIPVLNHQQACDPKKHIDAIRMQQDDAQASFIPVSAELATRLSDYAFALVMNNDSMVPELLMGDVLVIDPNKFPIPGNFVMAQINMKQEIIIRKYKQISASNPLQEFELIASNPNWALITIDDSFKGNILGCVLAAFRNF